VFCRHSAIKETRMVEVIIYRRRYGSPCLELDGLDDEGGFLVDIDDARELHAQLGACLGALDAETHPKNPEKKP